MWHHSSQCQLRLDLIYDVSSTISLDGFLVAVLVLCAYLLEHETTSIKSNALAPFFSMCVLVSQPCPCNLPFSTKIIK